MVNFDVTLESRGNLRDGDGFDWLDRETALAPSVEAAFERAHTGDPVMQQQERRTGARGFVWSRTVEDHFFVAGDLVLAGFDFL